MITRLRDTTHHFLFHLGSLLGSRLQRRWLEWFFQWVHRKADPWQQSVSPYEQYKYARTVAMLPPGRYQRVLEIGCSEGHLTSQIARSGRAGQIVAIDISSRAIERARLVYGQLPSVSFSEMDILSTAPDGPFDAIFCSEVLYYLGGSLPVCQRQIEALLRPGGVLILCHGWPVDEKLHDSFARSPAFSLHENVIDQHPQRPFLLTALTRIRPTESA